MDPEQLMHNVEGDYCPACRTPLMTTICHNKPGEHPKTGDPSLCYVCGQFLVFDENGKLRPMPDSVFNAFPETTKRALTTAQKNLRNRNDTLTGEDKRRIQF